MNVRPPVRIQVTVSQIYPLVSEIHTEFTTYETQTRVTETRRDRKRLKGCVLKRTGRTSPRVRTLSRLITR